MSWLSSMATGVSSWWSGEPTPPPEPVVREEEKDEMVPEERWVTALGYSSVLKRGVPDDIHKEPKHIALEPHGRKFSVRSKDYLESRVKIPSGPSLLRYAASDLIMAEGVDKLRHVSEFSDTLPQLHPERRFFVINWQLPGSPPFSFVLTFVFPTEEERAAVRATMCEEERLVEDNAWNLLEKFVSTDEDVDDKWRNSRFKLIPQIVEGPWYVRTVTPSNVPALIGNKLTSSYHQGPNYFEIDVDITSSIAANTIWAVVGGVTPSLVIDLAFVIQGNSLQELPEQVFGTVRVSRVTLDPKIVRVVVPTRSQIASPAPPASSPLVETAAANPAASGGASPLVGGCGSTPAVPATPSSTPVAGPDETSDPATKEPSSDQTSAALASATQEPSVAAPVSAAPQASVAPQ